jgi:hypothetical protein
MNRLNALADLARLVAGCSVLGAFGAVAMVAVLGPISGALALVYLGLAILAEGAARALEGGR